MAGWAGQSRRFLVWSVPEVRIHGRDHVGADDLLLVPSQEECAFCPSALEICETRERWVQRLTGLIHVVGKGKRCSWDQCEHRRLRYRSAEVGRLVLKGHEFGRDVVIWAGDQFIREKLSMPRIHKRLVGEFAISISERSVGNLVEDFLALSQCVAGDSGRLRERLRRQGAMVLAVDGVHFDEGSPVLYVMREVMSGEVLYSQRRLARRKEDLVPLLRLGADLAAEIGVPILGIVSDKEKSLVPAIAEAYPGVPHQFCQLHFLKNVSEPLKADDQELAQAAREAVVALRKVQRTLERRFPEVALSSEAVGVRLGAEAQAPEITGRDERRSAEAKWGMRPGGTETEAPGPAGRDQPRDESLSAEAKMAAVLVRAGTAAGVVSGRAVTDPPGLKRFERLQAVGAVADEAARKRGAPREGWPLINAVRDALRPLDSVGAVAKRLARHVVIVRKVARILDHDDRRAAQVKGTLRRHLNRLEAEAPRRGRGAATGHFVDHLRKVADSYWPGLFHAYGHPGIPRTTNDIEGFFGSSKQAVRATTGRSSTAGGKMQTCGEFTIAAQALIRVLPKPELEQRLNNVTDLDFAASQRQLRRIREPARERRSLQRRPQQLLDRALAEWRAPPVPTTG